MGTTEKAVVGVVLVIVVVVGLGYAYIMGIGPLEEDPAAGLEEPPETEETYEMEGGGSEEVGTNGDTDRDTDVDTEEDGGSSREEDNEVDRPPFAFDVESVKECGQTCREVNVALYNQMREDAEDVVVYTWIYAGDSTAREDVVWADNRDIPLLKAGDVRRDSDRVDVSVQQAKNIRELDGLITIEATVESQQETVTFVNQEKIE